MPPAPTSWPGSPPHAAAGPGPVRRRLLPVQDRHCRAPDHRLRDHHHRHRRAAQHTGVYRLATTQLDHRRCPASELVRLYHERREVESAYFAIKQSMLGRRVLRARTLPGIAQEIYALLTTYQVIRTAIADTTIDLVGTIGRAVLTHLMPARRLRLSPAPSNAQSPATRTRACASTDAPIRPPSASTSC
ncbi:transposase [Streptomyces angustmyceticus]